jgi:hypothetical protein
MLRRCLFHRFLWSRDGHGRLHLTCLLCSCVFDWSRHREQMERGVTECRQPSTVSPTGPVSHP